MPKTPYLDIDFAARLEVSFNGHLSHALRSACIFPLTGVKPPAEALTSLYAQWRARLTALSVAGWRFLADTAITREGGFPKKVLKLKSMRNCPPVTVRLKKSGADLLWTCKRVRLCPMCYARSVVMDAYTGFDWILGKVVTDRSKYALVAVTTISAFRLDQYSVGDLVTLSTSKKQVDLYAMAQEKIRPIGAKIDVTLAPSSKDPKMAIIRRSTLALCRSAELAAMPDFASRKFTKLTVARSVSGESLSSALGEALRYPIGMMQGDVNTTMAILHETAKRKARMSVSLGQLTTAKTVRRDVRDELLSGESDDYG
jgi:hypothetical protein